MLKAAPLISTFAVMSRIGMDREQYLLDLDEALLKGGVVLSEWCSFIVREADQAFIAKAHLPTILTAVAGIETQLRAEYEPEARTSLFNLIEKSSLDKKLKAEIHELRIYRNKWVHVDEPWNDLPLIHEPETFEEDLEVMAKKAIRLLREIIFQDLWV